MDLHTNLRGFAHKSAWRGQGSGFSTASGGLEGPGFRFFNGFVCKSTKVCVQTSWICTQTFVDLHTNLRDLHTGLEGPGFRIFTGLEGPGFQVFHYFSSHQICTICSVTFCRRWASFKLSKWLQGSGFSLFFFFTGSRGQGSGFSLASKGQGFRFFTTFRAIKYVRFVP